ncbi:nuclease homologue [Erythrobacter sp. HL-111]|nr:MAG: micrococcal nuclease related protein [Erythrobacteraceae bacterium HL-111]SDS83592.1 nuclease homologue [Erythrobacter sp. HL-111]
MGKVFRFQSARRRSRASTRAKARTSRVPEKRKARLFPVLLVAVPAAAFTAVLLAPGLGERNPAEAFAPHARTSDRETARFPLCPERGRRVTCIVDGDTIWYRGEKIRLVGFDTPEVFSPACPREAALGERATRRLQELLNAGPFSLEPNPEGRARDRYGRSLMMVTRGGANLGEVLLREGLAERYGGARREWC